MEKPLVSVVATTYNRADYLVEFLESLAAQTYPHWQVVVVDNNSTDHTQKVVEDFKERFPGNVLYLPQEKNLGFTPATALGLRKASGSYLSYMGDDDQILPDWLGAAVSTFEDDPQLGLVYANAWVGERVGEATHFPASYRGVRNKQLDALAYAQEIVNDRALCTQAVVFSRESYDAIGGMRTDVIHDLTQDTELWRAISEMFPITYIPDVHAFFRRHEQNITHTKRADFQFSIEAYWEYRMRQEPDQKFHKMMRRFLAKRMQNNALFYLQSSQSDSVLVKKFLSHAKTHRPWSLRLWAIWLISKLPVSSLIDALKHVKDRLRQSRSQ